MFDLKRLLHIGKSGPGTTANTTPLRDPIKLVAVTQNSDDAMALRQIAGAHAWKISIVDSSDAALALLKQEPTPLVICDRDLSGEDWRAAVERLAALPQAVCILLASPVADDYLWEQVIRHHGYDVVTKPFQPDELRRAVMFAWSWRGWAHRHNTEVSRKPIA